MESGKSVCEEMAIAIVREAEKREIKEAVRITKLLEERRERFQIGKGHSISFDTFKQKLGHIGASANTYKDVLEEFDVKMEERWDYKICRYTTVLVGIGVSDVLMEFLTSSIFEFHVQYTILFDDFKVLHDQYRRSKGLDRVRWIKDYYLAAFRELSIEIAWRPGNQHIIHGLRLKPEDV